MDITSTTGYRFVCRHISSIAFTAGFIFDALTLQRIDTFYTHLVFVGYLTIAALGIVLVHGVDTKRWEIKALVRASPWLPILVQFPLGGLYSGFVLFYTKSASFVTSWPFLTILLMLFIGNEFLRKRYERLVFQIGAFYFALLSYSVLISPIVLGTINTYTFMFAGVTSLCVVAVFTQLIKIFFKELYERSVRAMWLTIMGILAGFNILYFANVIPPVPLALTHIGVYHSVINVGGKYTGYYEAPSRYMVWRSTAPVYHRGENEAAYCFASIFAPTPIQTKVYHSWQQRTESGVWSRVSRIPYAIQGGRDNGYRGYSIKTNLPDGVWRCVVETEDFRTIGVTEFVVTGATSAPTLHQVSL